MVCDRFYDSTTAYQGYGRGIDIASINAINKIATKGIVPTLTVLVDITVEEIVKRKKKAGVPFDRMESLGRTFYERVRTGYLDIAEKEPGRLVVVNGMGPVQEVQREVWRAVEERLSITAEQAVRGSE
jgi:dTMP kinase